MGSGGYDIGARSVRAASSGYHTKTASEIFSSKLHESMNPMNLMKRECFDNADHPNSLPIIVALDVTGSMGQTPKHLIRDGLPHMMSTLLAKGLPDATVCFVAVGDQYSDVAPLQVGQFEAGDEELDKCLTNTWLEGNGGGDRMESYPLAWLFAAKHTHIHAWEKRKQKGFLFTIGDERFHKTLSKRLLESKVFGQQGYEADLDSLEILEDAKKMYEVFHIYIETGYQCQDTWKEILGDHLLQAKSHEDIPKLIADTVATHYHAVTTGTQPQGSNEPKKEDKIKITL
jgi:hypothetical protein